MIIRIKNVEALDNYHLIITFENNIKKDYDMNDDIDTLPGYSDLKTIAALWNNVAIDDSKTIVYWNDYIDIPSDTLFEFGKEIL